MTENPNADIKAMSFETALSELEKILSVILRTENVIGVDVCGECSPSLEVFEEERESKVNGEANQELLSLYLSANKQ